MALTEAEELEMLELEEQEAMGVQPMASVAQEPQSEGLGKQLLRSTVNALPAIGGAAGGIIGAGAGLFGGPAAPATVPAGGVVGGALGYGLGSEAKDLANTYLFGEAPKANAFDQPLEAGERVAGNLGEGAALEMGGQVIGKALGAGINAVAPTVRAGANKLGGFFNDAAENLAVKATGATGKQTEKFADDAGRQLLDRGLVKFGDSPAKIAERVGAASDDAGQQISSAIKGLDAQGVTASSDDIIAQLQARARELSRDPSQAPMVRKIESIIEDIQSTTMTAGPTASGMNTMPIGQAEQVKRGYGAKIKNWLDPEAGAANKEAYRAYMGEVERKALAADPALASQFKEGKETFGLLAPIEEAATKRAATLSQSPIGGLGDIAATAAGGGNPLFAVGRRLTAPRMASSGAWSADKIGKFLTESPQVFGKYAPVLQSAAQRGTQGLASTHFLLQQNDPAYREMIRSVADGDQ